MAGLGETLYTYRYPKGTLIIDRWNSTCGDCGKSANPHETHHNTLLGYGPDNGKPGCGVEWKHSASDYTNMQKSVEAMRPDLIWVGF